MSRRIMKTCEENELNDDCTSRVPQAKSKTGKQCSFEKLKALRAKVFKGTMNPGDVKKWLDLICDKTRSSRPHYLGRYSKGLEETFYPRSVVDSWRIEFLCLKQSDMTIAEHEKKFTKLAKYVIPFIMDEEDKFKNFEKGLSTTIRVLVTANENWSNFCRMVEAAMRVENTLDEGRKSPKEINKGKGSEEGFSRKTKFRLDQGSQWDNNRSPMCFERARPRKGSLTKYRRETSRRRDANGETTMRKEALIRGEKLAPKSSRDKETRKTLVEMCPRSRRGENFGPIRPEMIFETLVEIPGNSRDAG
ncbi:zinc finger CCHC domain-containing protein 5-like [Cucumis melo var. makuwa]|uniref:Zinc finger CCHC domain-containing protein 5-like n=1 Tax=Cucumis melo var. makuwa TaxID=1194695 RepID=A0A5A7U111_CUCMM|nr:zinc finger CCHC domain-containing protein 5-like [Cucumis melo var. makuwa]TYK01164.1 zinc finger CCHC domain-containing protein 5-like [Cucumis melo var. makuwa]